MSRKFFLLKTRMNRKKKDGYNQKSSVFSFETVWFLMNEKQELKK